MTPLKVLPLGAALLLAACAGSPAPQPQPQPVETTVQGDVVGAQSAGQVHLPGWPEIRAAMAADGRFTLTLPSEAQLAGRTQTAASLLSGLNCAGTVTSSDSAAQGYGLAALNVQDSAGSRDVFAASGRSPNLISRAVTAQAWIYSDRPTTLSGEVNCAALLGIPAISSLPVRVNVALEDGWNPVVLNIDAGVGLTGISASGTLRNAAASTGLTEWRTAAELQAQLGF